MKPSALVLILFGTLAALAFLFLVAGLVHQPPWLVYPAVLLYVAAFCSAAAWLMTGER